MLRTRRTTLQLIALVMLTVVLLVACGGEDDSAPASTPTQAPPPTSTVEPPGILTGTWALTILTTRANGVCLGEAFDPPYVEEVKVVQTGEEVTVGGVVDAIEPFWAGTFYGTKLSFEGSKSRHT